MRIEDEDGDAEWVRLPGLQPPRAATSGCGGENERIELGFGEEAFIYMKLC
jgi:hypothetical protein